MNSKGSLSRRAVGPILLLISLFACNQTDLSLKIPEKKPWNIVLILIDMLRADHLKSYGYKRETSPIIDRLAKEGILFENTITPASWTWPATASLITGVHPEVHGCIDRTIRLDDSFTTLTEILKKAGYQTSAFVANPYLKKALNFSQGFDFYDDGFVGMRSQQWWGEKMLIQNITPKIFNWIEQHSREPFFLYLHIIDVHGPYIKPTPFPKDGMEADEGINIYDGAILHTDKHLAQLLSKLREQDHWNNTLVVITADHGAQHGEYGIIDHGHYLYEPQIKIPLIFYHPHWRYQPKRVPQQVRIIDIAPTILSLVGEQQPAEMEGKSLLPLVGKATTHANHPPLAYSSTILDGCVMDMVRESNRWKLLTVSSHKAKSSLRGTYLFDISQSKNAETKNLIETNPHKAYELAQRLKQHRELNKGKGASRTTIDDQNFMEALRSLGYVE